MTNSRTACNLMTKNLQHHLQIHGIKKYLQIHYKKINQLQYCYSKN